MIIVSHRRNTQQELDDTPTEFGVEIDIRSRGDELILHHDPFTEGTNFEDWLQGYNHQLLILNVKEEGLEQQVLSHMAQHQIEQFFFLDQSFPFLLKTAKEGENRCAVRFSEYESLNTVLSVSDLVKWVWIDCFTTYPLDKNSAESLRRSGMKLCAVSPELQGRFAIDEIIETRKLIRDLGLTLDAVCTKIPEAWMEKLA